MIQKYIFMKNNPRNHRNLTLILKHLLKKKCEVKMIMILNLQNLLMMKMKMKIKTINKK